MAEILKENAERDLRAALVHAQALFCHSSLGTKIELKELSIMKMKGMHWSKGRKPGERASDLAEKYAKGADLTLQFAGCQKSGHRDGPNNAGCVGTAGLGPLNALCGRSESRRWAYSQWYTPSISGYVSFLQNDYYIMGGMQCFVKIPRLCF